MKPRNEQDANHSPDRSVGAAENYVSSIARLGTQKTNIIRDFIPKLLADFAQDNSLPKDERLLLLLELMNTLSESLRDLSHSVPSRPPRLWQERNREVETDPYQFIETTYKNYLHEMDMSDIRRLDFQLYRAFQQWKSKNGPPQGFLLMTKKQRTDDILANIAGRDLKDVDLAEIYEKLKPESRYSEAVRNRLRKR